MKVGTLMAALALAASLVAVPAGAAVRGAAPLDRHWLVLSARTDLFEIAGARIAATRATTPAAKDLAATVERDHAKALDGAAHIARGLGVKLPGTPTATEHWELHVLTTLSGTPFDRMYAWLEEARHVEAISDAQEAAGRAAAPTVRAYARSLLPVLRTHLRMATAAKKAAG
jgi:putative membrane protein